MKLLRNPISTTGLVLVAIAVVFYQVVSPRMRFGRAFPAVSGLPAPSSMTRALTAAPGQTSAAAPSRKGATQDGPSGIDREYAELHFDGWVEWPQRDPFLLLTPDSDDSLGNTETNSPVPTWKLRAIWAQTGSRLAVINRGAYREGDEIEGYRIDKIDTGGVWFIGPHERERLGFDTRPRPAVGTNAPPVSNALPPLIKP